MVIQHNMEALNAMRMGSIVVSNQKSRTEKLSSGYRINRAADDAAGLAISEKMRRQINGLTQASKNAQDGISLVQVADGALSEMHDILQRMNSLAVQSANDTNAQSDRQYIQQEIDQLGEEINRISKNTSFNEIYLFDMGSLVDIGGGDYSNLKFDEKANIGGTDYRYSKAMDFSKINASNVNELNGKSFSVLCSQGCSQDFTFTFSDSAPSSISLNTSNATRPDVNVTVNILENSTGSAIASKIYDLAKSKEAEVKDAAGVSGTIPAGASAAYIGHANALALDGASLIFFAPGNDSNGKIVASELEVGGRTLNLQVGAERGQLIGVNLYKINAHTLGVGDVDVTTQRGASEAIDSVKGGLHQLSRYRSYYGATQNRLEHTIKNLDNVVENTTAAESLIRDTDMAKMMVEYSNGNILQQAGTSMLAQANQNRQNVLSLLG